MADEILEDREMEIQASRITATRSFFVKATWDPFEAVGDSEIPRPGDPLPHWPKVTAKRAVPQFWDMNQSKVVVHYSNKTLQEEEEGHEHGDTRERWSWGTIRVKTDAAPDGTYIIPDGWDGDPDDLERAEDSDGDLRHDIGAGSGGVSTEIAVPALHLTLWTTNEPEEKDITRFYNKVNSKEYRGYDPWTFWARGATREKETEGDDESDSLWKVSFELALLDAPGGWQEIWQDQAWKEYEANGETRSKEVPVEPKYLSRVKEDVDFNEIRDLI